MTTLSTLYTAHVNETRSPAVLDAFHDWLPDAMVNKDGNGDGSGTIPDEQVDIIGN